MAVSSDGWLAVSASDDDTLKIWDVKTGRELRTLRVGSSGTVHNVALSADGRLAVSASDDHLKVWDVPTGRELRTLRVHSGTVHDVALSADGRLAVCASFGIEVRNVATGYKLHVFGGGEWVYHIALSADGRLAVSMSVDESRIPHLKLWDVSTGRKLHTLGEKRWVRKVALSSDGRLAVSVSGDNVIKVWDVSTGRKLHALTGHSSTVDELALSADGRLIASVSRDQTLKVWDVTSGCCVATLMFGDSLQCCAISAYGKTIVAGDSTGGVRILELVGTGEIPAPDQEEVEERSVWLPRWLKGFLRWQCYYER